MSDQEFVTPPPPPPARELPHTRFGIASFALALAASFGMAVMLAVAGVFEIVRPNVIEQSDLLTTLFGMALLFGAAFELVALALGIAGWVQRDRKRTFAVLGVVISGAVLALLTLVVLLSAE